MMGKLGLGKGWGPSWVSKFTLFQIDLSEKQGYKTRSASELVFTDIL